MKRSSRKKKVRRKAQRRKKLRSEVKVLVKTSNPFKPFFKPFFKPLSLLLFLLLLPSYFFFHFFSFHFYFSLPSLLPIDRANYVGKLTEWHQKHGFPRPDSVFSRPVQRAEGWTQCIFDESHFFRVESARLHYLKCRPRSFLSFLASSFFPLKSFFSLISLFTYLDSTPMAPSPSNAPTMTNISSWRYILLVLSA